MLVSRCSALLLAAAQPAVPITVEVRPATVYVERTPTGQFLNFDLVLTNTTADPVTLGAVTMSVLGGSGKLALRREINSDGERPSIDVLGAHELKPGQPELVMNPFERIEPGIDVHPHVPQVDSHRCSPLLTQTSVCGNPRCVLLCEGAQARLARGLSRRRRARSVRSRRSLRRSQSAPRRFRLRGGGERHRRRLRDLDLRDLGDHRRPHQHPPASK